ncbi:MAG: hypothetical protein ACTHNT_08990 [Actinomycetales bacterium]
MTTATPSASGPHDQPDRDDVPAAVPAEAVPAEANEADALEQQLPAVPGLAAAEDGSESAAQELLANPVEEANPADVVEQDTVVGVDEDDEPR